MKKSKLQPAPNPPSLSQLKSQKKPPVTPSIKKKPTKQSPSSSSKHKQPQPKKPQQPQDYIIINDSIYSANTFTQRNNYEHFLHKVKKEKQVERKSFLVKSQVTDENSTLKKSRQNASKRNQMFKKLTPQDFITTMTLQEKKEMFFKLQQQIRSSHSFKQPHYAQQPAAQPSYLLTKPSQPCSTESFQNLSSRNRLDSQRQRKEKFNILEEKLENLKMQLMFKWEGQIDRLEDMCRKGKIGEKEKENKVMIIEKLKDHKLKILDCTKTLFEKILKEEEYENQHNQEKANKIEAILQSLHSFPSLESMDEHFLEKEPNIDHLKVKSPQKDNELPTPKKNTTLNVDSSPLEIVEHNSHEAFLNDFREDAWEKSRSIEDLKDFKSPLNFLNNSPPKGRFAEYEEQNVQNQQTIISLEIKSSQQLEPQKQKIVHKPLFGEISEKLSFKLDLRLDEVVLGQDQYPQCEKIEEQEEQSKIEENGVKTEVDESDKYEKEPILTLKFEQSLEITGLNILEEPKPLSDQSEQPITSDQSLPPVSPPKVEKISMAKLTAASPPPLQQAEEVLACKQQPHQKMNINIPMILSREKMETLAYEQNRTFRQNLDKRVAFQMGCIQLQPLQPSIPVPFHFTTLVDINTYIVGFYEFMMKKYMSSLVDNLNIPYGKSAVDKLYSLQTEGFVLQESYNDMNNILGENHFVEYQREIMFTMRKCTEFETAHNRAVFEAFTKCINVYRPYYELQGQVFPWIVSEKGITFYEITEDNIQEVFQKSKIKVLEYCTALCGLLPPSQVKNQEQSGLMKQKNEQNLTKMIKTQILEHFEEWKIRFVNFQCLIRMLITDRIYAEIVNQCVEEVRRIEEQKVCS